MRTEARYLQVEAPTKDAVIDFMGKHAVQVKLELQGDKLWIYVQACDDRGTILQDQVLEVPQADDSN